MQNRNQNSPVWGARINSEKSRAAKDYPSWANNQQRKKWNKRGLILWHVETQQITHLNAKTALEALEHLRATSEWQQEGITLGEPATRLSFDVPEQKPRAVLVNQSKLEVAQTKELLELLERYEETLKKLSQEDQETQSLILSQVYDQLLGE